MSAIKEFVEQIIADGVITTEEHDQFMELVHQDGKIDGEESAQISRIFALLREGKLRVIDTERQTEDREQLEAEKQKAIADDEAAEEAFEPELSPEEEAERARKREAIDQVLAVIRKEKEAGEESSIAALLNSSRTNGDEQSEGKRKSSRINTLLQKAKERYAERED